MKHISDKAYPYVYMGTHKTTGQIYVGYREKNVLLGRTSDADLPLYRTSSKIVKPKFNEYDWVIVAEFLTGDDAFIFEQALICENWNNPLLLNKQYRMPNGKKKFKNNQCSDLTKEKIRTARTKQITTEETRLKMSSAKVGSKNNMFGKTHSPEARAKIKSRSYEDQKKRHWYNNAIQNFFLHEDDVRTKLLTRGRLVPCGGLQDAKSSLPCVR